MADEQAGDMMTISMYNLLTIMWLEKIDRKLIKVVQIEFADELKKGDQLFSLMPRMAKAMDSMLKKLETESAIQAIEADVRRVNMNTGRQSSRFERKGKGGGKPKDRNFERRRPFCPNCDFLRKAMKCDEIRTDHLPDRCPRTTVHNNAEMEMGKNENDFDE